MGCKMPNSTRSLLKFFKKSAKPKRLLNKLAELGLSRRRPVCFHQINEIGLFAQLTECVLLSKACSKNGLRPYFFIENKLSNQPGLSRNSLNYYFEHINLSKLELQECYRRVLDGDSIIIKNRYDINSFRYGNTRKELSNRLVTIEQGRGLFCRNLRPRTWLTDLVDDFWRRELSQGPALGVHYRGTDKSRFEADRISFSEVEAEIARHMPGMETIFVATDEVAFYDFLLQSPFGRKIKSYRVPKQNLSHLLDTQKNFRKGAEAIIDCLLLSRCNALVKTPSLLSAWSKVFNPHLEVYTVGRPHAGAYGNFRHRGYGFWPEKCLHPMPFHPKTRGD